MNNLFDPDSSPLVKYIWLMGVAFVGGIIGYFRKQWQKDKRKTVTAKVHSASLSVVTSMFVAYVVYEILIHFIGVINISVAIAGLASFAGTDLLVSIEEGFIASVTSMIKKFIKK